MTFWFFSHHENIWLNLASLIILISPQVTLNLILINSITRTTLNFFFATIANCLIPANMTESYLGKFLWHWIQIWLQLPQQRTWSWIAFFQWDAWSCWPWIYRSVFCLLWIGIGRRWASCSAGNDRVETRKLVSSLIPSLIIFHDCKMLGLYTSFIGLI